MSIVVETSEDPLYSQARLKGHVSPDLLVLDPAKVAHIPYSRRMKRSKQ
jgi:hypothetical protein